NLANGEDNRDGHSDNYSDNLGVEGPTADPLVRAARALRKRNMLATLFLSQGTPMILAGDEVGQTQGGNNNAYAQDNEVAWINWANTDKGLQDFVARLAALRAAHPVLRQKRFLHAEKRPTDGLPDVIWRKADGTAPSAHDWHDASFRCLCVELRMAAEGPDASDAIFAVFNTGSVVPLTLPDTAKGWQIALNTTQPLALPGAWPKGQNAPAHSVLVFSALGGPA
ncbi:MAG: glycogen debranching protein GlgX, partial [Paracoccaceae bacterium]